MALARIQSSVQLARPRSAPPPEAAASSRRDDRSGTRERTSAPAIDSPRSCGRAPLGVNVAGYLNTESGMGEAARLSVRSLEAAGIPVALNNVASRLRMQDGTSHVIHRRQSAPVQSRPPQRRQHGMVCARARARVFSRSIYDRVLVLGARAVSAGLDVRPSGTSMKCGCRPSSGARHWPVARPCRCTCVPLPVVAPPAVWHIAVRTSSLPDDAYVFLFTFDVSSQMERKNPLGLIVGVSRGVRRAARRHAGAEVYECRIRSGGRPQSLSRSRGHQCRASRRVHGARRAGWVDGRSGLLRLAASFEGFGLGIAEAMALGKPVIATHYSGPADFMTAANSYPVDYRLVPIPRDYGPYLEGFTWAEPDLEQASRLMRHVVEHRDEADGPWTPGRGRHRRNTMRRPRTGAHARKRLEEIRSGRAADRTADSRRALARLEIENRAVREELDLVLSSKGRRLMSDGRPSVCGHFARQCRGCSDGSRWLPCESCGTSFASIEFPSVRSRPVLMPTVRRLHAGHAMEPGARHQRRSARGAAVLWRLTFHIHERQ